jgi:hypothetical protein
MDGRDMEPHAPAASIATPKPLPSAGAAFPAIPLNLVLIPGWCRKSWAILFDGERPGEFLSIP